MRVFSIIIGLLLVFISTHAFAQQTESVEAKGEMTVVDNNSKINKELNAAILLQKRFLVAHT